MKCPKCGSVDLQEIKSSLIFRCKKCSYQSHKGSFLEEGEKGEPKYKTEFKRVGENLEKKIIPSYSSYSSNLKLTTKERLQKHGIPLDCPITNIGNKKGLTKQNLRDLQTLCLDDGYTRRMSRSSKRYGLKLKQKHRKLELRQIQFVCETVLHFSVSVQMIMEFKHWLEKDSNNRI